MRLLTSLLVSAAVCSAASAAPWADSSQTISLDAPAGWTIASAPADDLTYVVASSSASECHIIGIPRPATAETSPQVIRIASLNEMDERSWMAVANAMPEFFAGRPSVQSHRVDTAAFWPVQRADFDVADAAPVFAAIQFRPGLEIWSLCRGGADDVASAYEALFASIGTPTDADLQQRAESDEASAEEYERQARAFAIGERRIMTPVHAHDDDGYIVDPRGRGRDPLSD
jgi:hypothetical protein